MPFPWQPNKGLMTNVRPRDNCCLTIFVALALFSQAQVRGVLNSDKCKRNEVRALSTVCSMALAGLNTGTLSSAKVCKTSIRRVICSRLPGAMPRTMAAAGSCSSNPGMDKPDAWSRSMAHSARSTHSASMPNLAKADTSCSLCQP